MQNKHRSPEMCVHQNVGIVHAMIGVRDQPLFQGVGSRGLKNHEETVRWRVGVHSEVSILSSLFSVDRYVERMRKRKLQGGKQDIAGTKEEDPRTKDWIVELNAASRALAVRWLRAAREGLDGKFRLD